MKSSNNTIWVGLSFLAVGLMVGLLLSNPDAFSTNRSSGGAQGAQTVADVLPNVVQVSVDDDPFIGEENAPVTIVEFSNFQCHYCQEFHAGTLPKIIGDYVDKGLVKFVYRDFPPSSYPQALITAEAAECVDQLADDETYFKMHDLIFDGVKEWSLNEAADEVLVGYANSLGLDISTCLADREAADEVEADYIAGKSYGVRGTPTFFINGRQVTGAQSYDLFKTVIDFELEALAQ